MRKKDSTRQRGVCQRRVSAGEVRSLAKALMTGSLKLEAHGYKCTTGVLLQVLYWAAARCTSIGATCVILADVPSDQTIRDALRTCLPKRVGFLEQRINKALANDLPRSVRRRARRIAIDWHQIPYHGQPLKSVEELRRSQPRSGTSTFHVYATACIVEGGQRFTLGLTRVLRSDSSRSVLERLYKQIQTLDVRIKMLFLDRQFYSTTVIDWLQRQGIPFVMPVSLRGRKPQPGTRVQGLRALLKAHPGWSQHTLRAGPTRVQFAVCICWKMARHPRKKRLHRKVMLYACWRVRGTPHNIRESYRRRFGIEASYRQLGQHRIRTSTRDPLLRLLFVGLALLLRNIWVWLHLIRLATVPGDPSTVCLHRLRLRHLTELLTQHDPPTNVPTPETGNY